MDLETELSRWPGGLKDTTRENINLKKFKLMSDDLRAMVNPHSASAMQAILMSAFEHFRRMDPKSRIQAVEALTKQGVPFDLVGLCKYLRLRPLVFIACTTASGALRLQIDYGEFLDPEERWIFLLTDGNGLLWLPVSMAVNGGHRYIFTQSEAERFKGLTTEGPCAEYSIGSSVIYNGLLYTIVKKNGQKYIIEDTNDSSKQKEVKNTDLGAAPAARTQTEILNRLEETKRRMDHTVVNYDTINVSVFGFYDYVKEAAKSSLQLSVQYS